MERPASVQAILDVIRDPVLASMFNVVRQSEEQPTSIEEVEEAAENYTAYARVMRNWKKAVGGDDVKLELFTTQMTDDGLAHMVYSMWSGEMEAINLLMRWGQFSQAALEGVAS